jgi:hypothetical protein
VSARCICSIARACSTPRSHPGPETIEARLFAEHEVPWDQIAFRTVRVTLERFFEDRRRGAFEPALHRHRLRSAQATATCTGRSSA